MEEWEEWEEWGQIFQNDKTKNSTGIASEFILFTT